MQRDFHQWLQAGLLHNVATALREDQHAVAQEITTPCYSGANEGRISDVKLQKRIMAGRADVQLLRHRVVHADNKGRTLSATP
ncbi:hypothetical protein [Streptomyces sp. NPDC002402]